MTDGQPPDRSDVVVIGAGIMGRAVAWQLAQRGVGVTVLEQFEAGHEFGSSHGATRALIYGYDDPAYARLAMHAFTWWRVAERMIGDELLTQCGGLDVGHSGSASFDRKLMTVRDLGLDHELLDPESISRRFPDFSLPSGYVGLFCPGSAGINARRAMQALLQLAEDSGAHVEWNAQVTDLSHDSTGCCVHFEARGERSANAVREIRCDRIIICAGPWTPELVGPWPSLQVVRCESHFFTIAREMVGSTQPMPMFFLHPDPEDEDGLYGQFQTGQTSQRTVKLERLAGTPVDSAPPGGHPNGVDSAIAREVAHALSRRARTFLPGIGTSTGGTRDTCLATVTPDHGFYLDWLNPEQRVFLCGGFSSHGFKFAPVVGAVVADLVDGGYSDYEIDSMKLDRFAPPNGDSTVT